MSTLSLYLGILGGSWCVGELGEGSWVADRLLEVRTMVPFWDMFRPLRWLAALSSLLVLSSGAPSQ